MSGNTLSSLVELQVPSKKRSDPDSQSDIDIAILEYLIYMATMALLVDAQTRDQVSLSTASSRKTEVSLQMVDCESPKILIRGLHWRLTGDSFPDYLPCQSSYYRPISINATPSSSSEIYDTFHKSNVSCPSHRLS